MEEVCTLNCSLESADLLSSVRVCDLRNFNSGNLSLRNVLPLRFHCEFWVHFNLMSQHGYSTNIPCCFVSLPFCVMMNFVYMRLFVVVLVVLVGLSISSMLIPNKDRSNMLGASTMIQQPVISMIWTMVFVHSSLMPEPQSCGKRCQMMISESLHWQHRVSVSA